MTTSLQIKKGRPNYYVVLAYKEETSGKNKTKRISTDIPIKGNNKRLANEKMKEVLVEYEKIEYHHQNDYFYSDMMFDDFMVKWLNTTKSSIKENTFDEYKIVVDNQIVPFYFPNKLKLKDIRPLHIQKYLDYKLESASTNTALKHLIYISKALDFAVKQNLIPSNPAQKIDKPKKQKYKGARFYDENQIKQLISCVQGNSLGLVIFLAAFYGLRRSEILGLKWSSIDFLKKTITIEHTVVKSSKKIVRSNVTKTNSSYRILPIPPVVVDVLKREQVNQAQNKLLQANDYFESDYVCVKADGILFHPNYVSKYFKKILIENNLPVIRLHDLRHSSATFLLSQGFNMKEVSEFLGHSSISTTMNLYAHVNLEAKKAMTNNLNEKFSNIGSF